MSMHQATSSTIPQESNKYCFKWYANPNTKLPIKSLQELGKNNEQPIYLETNQKRDKLTNETKSISIQAKISTNTTSTRVGRNTEELCRTKDCERGSRKRISKPFLCSETTGENSTNTRPPRIEQTLENQNIQNGGTVKYC